MTLITGFRESLSSRSINSGSNSNSSRKFLDNHIDQTTQTNNFRSPVENLSTQSRWSSGLSWVPPRGDMIVQYLNQKYLVQWVRGKKTGRSWSVSGYFSLLVNGKPTGGKLAISNGSQILPDGRLSVRMRSFNNTPIVSKLSVFQTRNGKWYKRFHDLYTKIRQDASRPDLFKRVGNQRLDATESTIKLADFVRDYGAGNIMTPKDPLSGWLRKHIFALTNPRAYGAAKAGRKMSIAVQHAANAGGMETSNLKVLFSRIVREVRAEAKNGFKELRRYKYIKDPGTGRSKRTLVGTGYTRATLRLAAFLAEAGPISLGKMARSRGGVNVAGVVRELTKLPKVGKFVTNAAKVAGLTFNRGRSLLPDLSRQGYFYTSNQILIEANNVLTHNVANAQEVAQYDLWARTGRRILNHNEAVAAADAWRANFNANIPEVVDHLYQFLVQPGVLRRAHTGPWQDNRLRVLLRAYLTTPPTDPQFDKNYSLLRSYGLRSGFANRFGNEPDNQIETLPQLVNLVVFGRHDLNTVDAARDGFVEDLDNIRRNNAEAALTIARAGRPGSYAELFRILLGIGMFTVEHGKYRGP